MDLNFKDDPVYYIKEKFDLFLTIAKRDPIEAIKFVPEIAGGLGVLAVTVFVIVVSLATMGSGAAPTKEQVKDAAKKAKDATVEAKDKAAEAVASGAEKAQAEVNKRATRSSAT